MNYYIAKINPNKAKVCPFLHAVILQMSGVQVVWTVK